MYRSLAFTGLVSVLILAPLAAHAQGRPAGPPAPSSAELYSELQALKAQVAQLQQQLAQQKAADDKGFFDDRFRLAAIEANEKAGGTASQLQASINALSNKQAQDEASIGGIRSSLTNLGTQVNTLGTKFAGHTHDYQLTKIGFTNVSLGGGGYASLIQKNVGESATTSPPK